MMSSRERLKRLIDERVHHKNDWDKIPAITSDGIYTYLYKISKNTELMP